MTFTSQPTVGSCFKFTFKLDKPSSEDGSALSFDRVVKNDQRSFLNNKRLVFNWKPVTGLSNQSIAYDISPSKQDEAAFGLPEVAEAVYTHSMPNIRQIEEEKVSDGRMDGSTFHMFQSMDTLIEGELSRETVNRSKHRVWSMLPLDQIRPS